MIRIRLARVGKKKQPSYRLVVANKTAQRDGRFIEILGHYDPLREPAVFEFNEERVREWISKGAQPSDSAASLLARHGVGQAPKRTSKPPKPAAPVAQAEPAAAAPPTSAEPAPAAAEVDEVPATAEAEVDEAPATAEAPTVAAPTEEAPDTAEATTVDAAIEEAEPGPEATSPAAKEPAESA